MNSTTMIEQLSHANSETTSWDTPDPDITGFEITGHRLLLRPVHVEGKTKSGLILAKKTQHDLSYLMNVCKVLKVGPTAYTQEMFEKTGPWCKVGDFVMIPKLGGQKIKFKGVPLTMISCDQVLAIIEKPEDVDCSFNISTESI
jgi:co-chaperonin GroES (HSP10)